MNKPQIKKLVNGLTLIYIPHKEVKSVTIHLRGKAGSSFESYNQVGSAHLIEHLSLENELRDNLLFLGGKIVGVTSRDDVLYMVKINQKDLETAIKYLFAVFGKTDFTQPELEIKKGVVNEEIKRFENIPEKLIGRLFYKNLFPSQRMAKFNTGDLDDIRKLSLSSLLNFKQSFYVPENFVLTFSGNIDPTRLNKLVLKYFGNLVKGIKADSPIHKANDKTNITCVESSFFKQNHLKLDYYGYNLNEPKRHYSNLLAKIIDMLLKDKVKSHQGYTYNINCNSFSSGRYGLFSFYFASSEEHFKEIFKEIVHIVYHIGDILTSRLLEAAKNQIITDLEFNYEKTSFRSDYYSQLYLYGNLKEDINSEINFLQNSTVSDLINVAKEIFSQNPKITVLSKNITSRDIKKLWKSYLQK